MIMLRSVPSRFLAFLVCMLLCVSMAAAEDISASLTPDAETWKAGEVLTFSGEVRHPGTDLSYAGLVMEIRTEPDAGDKGSVVVTSVNGVEEDPDRWRNEMWLGADDANGDMLRFSGQWTVPEGAQFNKVTLTLSVIHEDAVVVTATCEIENASPVINLHGLTVWQLAAILLAIIAVITGIWFLLHRKKDEPEEIPDNKKGGRLLDTVIIALFFLGVILMPIMIRFPFVYSAYKPLGFLSYVNIPCTLALLLSFLRLKKWTKTDLLFFAAWLLLLIPMCISNREIEYTKYVLVPFQNLLPIYFIFYRMNEQTRQKTIRLFMILFNVFIFFLLLFAIEEKITGKAIVKAFTDWLVSRNMYAQEITRFSDEARFFSFWGHPLTNALLFNSCLALNAAWCRSRGKKIYALMYVPIAMAGVLLSGSKTGITVCFLLLIVICWEYKKWMLLGIPIFAALYFVGAFNAIIDRFLHTPLTSGRLEALTVYFTKWYSQYPLKWNVGYGSNAILSNLFMYYKIGQGLEIPILMISFDYGIIFAVVLMAGSYLYISWKCFKKRQWTIWLCYTLVFAEINTYNGYALRNQDVFIFGAFVAMIMLNMLPDKAPEKLRG